MRRVRIALALTLSAAFAICLAASLRTRLPDRAVVAATGPTAPAPRREMALYVRPGKAAMLDVLGTSTLPDGSILNLTLWRHAEQDRRGRLEEALEVVGKSFVQISDGVFSWEQPVLIPGRYTLQVELREDLQPRDILRQLPRVRSPRRWDFEFQRWGDDLLSRMRKDLSSVYVIVGNIRALHLRMDQAASSAARWKQSNMAGDPSTYAYMLQDEEFRYLFPAVHRDLLDSLRAMSAATRHFFWQPDEAGGGFGGAFDVSERKWILGPDGRPFNFQRLDTFLEQTGGLARREYALWILKDVRRAGLREALREAARSGPDEARAVLADLEAGKDPTAIEETLRGKERPAPLEPAPEPPRAAGWAARRKKLDDAKGLLETADRLWNEVGDDQAPILYRKLLSEFPEVLDDLHARTRVANRARQVGD